MKFGPDDCWISKLRKVHENRLNHFHALSIGVQSIHDLLSDLTHKTLINKVFTDNIHGIKQCEVYSEDVDEAMCSREEQTNEYLNFIKIIQPIELIISGPIVIDQSFIFHHSLINSSIKDYNDYFQTILDIFINKTTKLIKKLSFIGTRFCGDGNNSSSSFRYANVKFQEISDYCKYKSSKLQSIKIENCDAFLTSLILHHFEFSNICQLCIDIQSILCDNEDVVCQDWFHSGIKFPNLTEFSFTDSDYVATKIKDIGLDLITFIFFESRKQLKKVSINQAHCRVHEDEVLQNEEYQYYYQQDNERIRNRLSVYSYILKECRLLKTLQYSRGVPDSVYCRYNDDIFHWIIEFLKEMNNNCKSFCLSLCTHEAVSTIEDLDKFELLFATYLPQLTQSLNIKTDGSYFIIAQIRQQPPNFNYKINEKIKSDDESGLYKIYDEFGNEITKDYRPHSQCIKSQTVTVIGPKCRHDMCIGDFRMETDFSWNQCVFENQTSLESYIGDSRHWKHRQE